MIRTTALLLALCAAPLSLHAQEAQPRDLDESLDLFADGAREFFESLETELAPLLRDLGAQLDGLSRYEAPEILPNGENAHCTVRPARWWATRVGAHFDFVRKTRSFTPNSVSLVTWPRPDGQAS